MSPLSLRRHRAERLLREQFDGLRGQVLASVSARLRASGASLDRADLEACYAQAWQGLYTAVEQGEQIANATGWLVLVTYRRALDEHRARARSHCHGELGLDRAGVADAGAPGGQDAADALDDRVRLRQVFEGLRHRLDDREREAAALCYLQGLSRAQAAERMGVSEGRMRKLMEGRGPGRQGVAAKMGELVKTISDGGWCEEQSSLMRALAFGVLAPGGERHRLAMIHSSRCPACRAYVASLRGLAATLPPVLLPGGASAVLLAHLGEGAHAVLAAGAGKAGVGAGAARRMAGGASTGTRAGLQAGRGVGGAVSASGAAGAGGAAGGGWLVGAAPFAGKLAVGCLLALGVGAGCVALGSLQRTPPPRRPRHLASRPHTRPAVSTSYAPELAGAEASQLPAGTAADGSSTTASAPLTPAAKASREFGPEQALAGDPSSPPAHSASAKPHAGGHPRARVDAAERAAPANLDDIEAEPTARVAASSSDASTGEDSGGDSSAAEREFSPG